MRKVVLTLMLVSAAIVPLTSCAGPGEASSVISGRLLAGPICPVETDPPDPSCTPAPVAGAKITALTSEGDGLVAFSDPEGRFSMMIPPGTLTVRFDPVPGLMGTPADLTIHVEPSETVDLGEIMYDTGIR